MERLRFCIVTLTYLTLVGCASINNSSSLTSPNTYEKVTGIWQKNGVYEVTKLTNTSVKTDSKLIIAEGQVLAAYEFTTFSNKPTITFSDDLDIYEDSRLVHRLKAGTYPSLVSLIVNRERYQTICISDCDNRKIAQFLAYNDIGELNLRRYSAIPNSSSKFQYTGSELKISDKEIGQVEVEQEVINKYTRTDRLKSLMNHKEPVIEVSYSHRPKSETYYLDDESLLKCANLFTVKVDSTFENLMYMVTDRKTANKYLKLKSYTTYIHWPNPDSTTFR